jgi:hypothetical protein
MKNFLLIFFTAFNCLIFLCPLSSQSIVGSWSLLPESGAVGVGSSKNNMNWWSIGDDWVTQRPEFFDDKYIFYNDGSFKIIQDGATLLWFTDTGDNQSGQPIYPHDGSNDATFIVNTQNNLPVSVTLYGQGAYLGVARATNNGEIASTGPTPYSRTYEILEITDDRLTVAINIGIGYWTIKLKKNPPSDSDGDGINDNVDQFPNDPSEILDTDNDGVGDNADAFPNDSSESVDSDNDGVGDNADAFPNDSFESIDSDNDGVGNNADAFPNDATETNDSDGDGIGDNADAFPYDADHSSDSDEDGIADIYDAFPEDPNEYRDLNENGIGDVTDAVNIAYLNGLSEGQNLVINSPNDHNLYSEEQYDQNANSRYSSGYSDGEDSVVNSPSAHSLYTQNQYDQNANSRYTAGIIDGKNEVQTNPNNYFLYTSNDLLTYQANALIQGQLNVINNPSSFNLYSLSSMTDLRAGSTMIEIHDGQAILTMEIEQSDDLGIWTTGGASTLQIPIDAEAGKKFFRFKMAE